MSTFGQGGVHTICFKGPSMGQTEADRKQDFISELETDSGGFAFSVLGTMAFAG